MTQTPVGEPVVHRGLPTQVITDWERRIGIDPAGTDRPNEIRLKGREGIPYYGQHVRVDIDDPDEFDSVMYARQLSTMGTFCSLHTPFRVERTAALIHEQPSDDLVVGVHTLRGSSSVKQGTRDYDYLPGQLVIVSNAAPYVEHTRSIADPAGLVIPLEKLGDQRHIAEVARRPVASHTLLSRATASFIRQFAYDTAAGFATEPNAETEHAAIELVRAALGQLNYDRYQLSDNALFIRQAAIDLVERNHCDADFTPDTIARTLHISRRQLYRHFEDSSDSLAAIIAERRAQTAREMLLNNRLLSIGEVAAASGFPSVATMRNRFRSRFGLSPNELRMKEL